MIIITRERGKRRGQAEYDIEETFIFIWLPAGVLTEMAALHFHRGWGEPGKDQEGRAGTEGWTDGRMSETLT